ncbi:hypothetical protein TNCV_819431 [Trichonephila clavipes]|nr:hypothetical protein TNCV_819431 [Trichonephila clavipes]
MWRKDTISIRIAFHKTNAIEDKLGAVRLKVYLNLGKKLSEGIRQKNEHITSATLVFGYHFDMAKKRILTHNEIDRQMNNSVELSELSEDGLEYFDDDVDFLPDCVSSNEDSDGDCENT